MLPDIEFDGLARFRIEKDSVSGSGLFTFATRHLAGALAANYKARLDHFDTLVIEGIDGSSGDLYAVTNPTGDPTVATVLDSLSGVTVRDVENNAKGRLQISTLGGDDLVTIDAGSVDLIGLPILYDGGAGSDALDVHGIPANAVDEVVYRPGPAVSEGRLLYEGAGDELLMTIDFVNLEPDTELVLATTLTVNGTDAGNTIDYSQSTLNRTWGRVAVDSFESTHFANKNLDRWPGRQR